MKIRGTRECKDCGAQWSYYETGSVECPECGSLRSVGVEEKRRLHTASPATLDLTPVRNELDSLSLRQVAERAVEEVRPFARQYGFIDAGDLQPLDDTYLAARELLTVADAVARATSVDDDEEYYFLRLLRSAEEGDRPTPDEVPASLRDSRGLAYANAVKEYRSDLRTYLEEYPDAAAESLLETLGDHVTRVRNLEGDVDPETAERLVQVARGLGRYLANDDEAALKSARDRLSRLG